MVMTMSSADSEKRTKHDLEFQTALEIARARGYWTGGEA